MTRDPIKIALRRHSIKRWAEGRKKAGFDEPNEVEIKTFITAFNMGYAAHKQKRFK